MRSTLIFLTLSNLDLSAEIQRLRGCGDVSMETELDMAAAHAAKKELRKTLKEKLSHVDKDNVAAQCMHPRVHSQAFMNHPH